MHLKNHIFILLTFLVFSLLSCSQPPSQNQQKAENQKPDNSLECIERVLAEDNALGVTRNHDCETISLDSTIIKYADRLGKIEFSNCPETFTLAFEKHRQAWLEMIPLAKKFPDLRGEMHDLFDIIEKSDQAETFKPLLKAVWDTWGEVDEAMKAAGFEPKTGE